MNAPTVNINIDKISTMPDIVVLKTLLAFDKKKINNKKYLENCKDVIVKEFEMKISILRESK